MQTKNIELNVKTTNQYCGVLFNPTGKSKKEGFNCLTLCTDWLINILKSDLKYENVIIDDITWDNVRDKFLENPEEVFSKVESVLLKYVDIIDVKDIKKGDFLAVKLLFDDKTIPAVYVGMGKIMITTNIGVKFFNNKHYKIKKAYRIKK